MRNHSATKIAAFVMITIMAMMNVTLAADKSAQGQKTKQLSVEEIKKLSPEEKDKFQLELAKKQYGGDRRVAINPQKQTDGVKSGMVIAYGHPIPPPYKFEYRGNALFINNIQVEPSIVAQREYDKTRHMPSAKDRQNEQQTRELIRTTREIYFAKQGKVSDEQLQSEILALVKSQSWIRDARWYSNKSLRYIKKGDKYEDFGHGINFLEDRPPQRVIGSSPSIEEIHKKTINRYEEHLKAGNCFVWGSVGMRYCYGQECPNLKTTVNQIMNQKSLSSDDKARQLRGIFKGSYDMPLDIITNYNAEEWK